MDTYYRLLRAEVYSGIQKGIKDLKSNTVIVYKTVAHTRNYLNLINTK